MRHYLTLSKANQFKFVCPIFGAETRFSACAKLRDIVYVGGRPPVRKGCQACIASSKCPAAEVIRRISFGGGVAPDDHCSETPTVGKLRRDVLERIAPVVVLEATMSKYGVPDGERALINSSRERIEKAIATAPKGEFDYNYSRPTTTRSASKSTAKAAKPAPKSSNDNINQAAATGDLAAAVSL